MRRVDGSKRAVSALMVTLLVVGGCRGIGHHELTRRVAEPEPALVEVDEATVAATVTEPASAVAPGPTAPSTDGPAVERSPSFLVGDSTMVEAARVTGMGSAHAGYGFTDQTPYGLRNPLAPPPADYDGLVVAGVSVWDVWATDLSGYREATEHYRALGHEVVWIEVPPTTIPYAGGRLEPELVTLNSAVAEELGCELQPWTLRDVESYGAAGGDHSDDWLHPTPNGGAQIVENVSTLTLGDVCTPRSGPDSRIDV